MIDLIGAGVSLLLASRTDLRTGHVPDWIPMSLVAFSSIAHIFHPFLSLSNSMYLLGGLLVLIGLPDKATDHIGGGDLKMIVALSYVLGMANVMMGLALGLIMAFMGKKREGVRFMPYMAVGILTVHVLIAISVAL